MEHHSHTDALAALLAPVRKIQVVDIGANPVDGDPPYQPLLVAGLCEVTGFEPQPEALRVLNQRKGEGERYLPYAVGDGQTQELKTCRASGMTSLLEPDPRILSHFEFLALSGEVLARTPLPTKRLDDMAEIAALDFLKIDVQGSELSVFQHGAGKLAGAVVVQTEVSFLPLYENQPVFGEIDLELRRHGFLPHCFAALKNWIIAPTVINNDPRIALRQLIEADLVYVRDFTRPLLLDDEQLKRLALIAHTCYRSYDLTNRCLFLLEQRGTIPPGSQSAYLQSLGQRSRETA